MNDINYYYENMMSVVTLIKKPLDAYLEFQKTISAEIQEIGGIGKIHGCIIDINWRNHVFINPFNMKITGYMALDKTYRKIYPTVSALLEKECPALYERYTELLKENSKNLPALEESEDSDLALLDSLEINAYVNKISKEVNKMQKLSSNILATWREVDNINKMIESRPKRKR